MVDMFLVSIPPQELDVPPAAPAVIKGIAEANGFKISTHDFNLDFILNYQLNDSLSYWFSDQTTSHPQFELIDKFYDHCVDVIKKNPARWVGISVFSVLRHKAALELCQRIRRDLPDQKIVVGGHGLTIRVYQKTIGSYLTSGEKMLTLDQVLIKKKLVDQVIIGEAEDAILDLLSDKIKLISLDRHTPIDNTLKYPFSNFDDYDLPSYSAMGKVQLPVISSKGCVRRCDFCDVVAHFSKFQAKDGRRLAEEMIYLSERYSVYDFGFLDSIANGNMKALKQACKILAEYNANAPVDKKITWSANWICRPEGTVKPGFFDLMKAAGAVSLIVGTETGSNHVLKHMDKKTTVEGMYYELEHIDRVGIQVQSNQIIGHWSERYEDFLDHIDMLLRFGIYLAKGTITGISIGPTFHVLEESPAMDYAHSGIKMNPGDFEIAWFSEKNPELTIRVRLARLMIICRLVLMYNYGHFTTYGAFLLLVGGLEHMKDKWPEFYKPYLKEYLGENFEDTCPSIELRKQNLEEFFQSRMVRHYPTCQVELVLNASHCNGAPNFYFKYNDTVCYSNELAEGNNNLKFEFEYDYSGTNNITLGMDNKTYSDTQIDDTGNIIADKNISIISLKIDGIELIDNYEMYYKNATYTVNGEVSDTSYKGFYSNSSISWEFRAPFWTKVLQARPNAFRYELGYDKIEDLLESIDKEIDQIKYR